MTDTRKLTRGERRYGVVIDPGQFDAADCGPQHSYVVHGSRHPDGSTVYKCRMAEVAKELRYYGGRAYARW